MNWTYPTAYSDVVKHVHDFEAKINGATIKSTVMTTYLGILIDSKNSSGTNI